MSVSPATNLPNPRLRRSLVTGALVIVAALVGAACGDSGDDKPTAAKSDFAAYCDASFNIESYFGQDPEVDFETATPEEIDAAIKTYLQGAKPLVDAALPLVPAEIKAPIDVQVGVFNKALAGEVNPEEAFETPEVKAAEAKSHAFDLKNCGWAKVDVTAEDYSFQGIPTELTAGRTSIEFANKGTELHEITLLAKNEGVTESFDEILALSQEELESKVTPVTGAFASPGDDDYTIVDLAKGEYVAVCFIPQGLTSDDAQPSPDAKPHFVLGMKKEITVA